MLPLAGRAWPAPYPALLTLPSPLASSASSPWPPPVRSERRRLCGCAAACGPVRSAGLACRLRCAAAALTPRTPLGLACDGGSQSQERSQLNHGAAQCGSAALRSRSRECRCSRRSGVAVGWRGVGQWSRRRQASRLPPRPPVNDASACTDAVPRRRLGRCLRRIARRVLPCPILRCRALRCGCAALPGPALGGLPCSAVRCL